MYKFSKKVILTLLTVFLFIFCAPFALSACKENVYNVTCSSNSREINYLNPTITFYSTINGKTSSIKEWVATCENRNLPLPDYIQFEQNGYLGRAIIRLVNNIERTRDLTIQLKAIFPDDSEITIDDIIVTRYTATYKVQIQGNKTRIENNNSNRVINFISRRSDDVEITPTRWWVELNNIETDLSTMNVPLKFSIVQNNPSRCKLELEKNKYINLSEIITVCFEYNSTSYKSAQIECERVTDLGWDIELSGGGGVNANILDSNHTRISYAAVINGLPPSNSVQFTFNPNLPDQNTSAIFNSETANSGIIELNPNLPVIGRTYQLIADFGYGKTVTKDIVVTQKDADGFSINGDSIINQSHNVANFTLSDSNGNNVTTAQWSIQPSIANVPLTFEYGGSNAKLTLAKNSTIAAGTYTINAKSGGIQLAHITCDVEAFTSQLVLKDNDGNTLPSSITVDDTSNNPLYMKLYNGSQLLSPTWSYEVHYDNGNIETTMPTAISFTPNNSTTTSQLAIFALAPEIDILGATYYITANGGAYGQMTQEIRVDAFINQYDIEVLSGPSNCTLNQTNTSLTLVSKRNGIEFPIDWKTSIDLSMYPISTTVSDDKTKFEIVLTPGIKIDTAINFNVYTSYDTWVSNASTKAIIVNSFNPIFALNTSGNTLSSTNTTITVNPLSNGTLYEYTQFSFETKYIGIGNIITITKETNFSYTIELTIPNINTPLTNLEVVFSFINPITNISIIDISFQFSLLQNGNYSFDMPNGNVISYDMQQIDGTFKLGSNVVNTPTLTLASEIVDIQTNPPTTSLSISNVSLTNNNDGTFSVQIDDIEDEIEFSTIFVLAYDPINAKYIFTPIELGMQKIEYYSTPSIVDPTIDPNCINSIQDQLVITPHIKKTSYDLTTTTDAAYQHIQNISVIPTLPSSFPITANINPITKGITVDYDSTKVLNDTSYTIKYEILRPNDTSFTVPKYKTFKINTLAPANPQYKALITDTTQPNTSSNTYTNIEINSYTTDLYIYGEQYTGNNYTLTNNITFTLQGSFSPNNSITYSSNSNYFHIIHSSSVINTPEELYLFVDFGAGNILMYIIAVR